MAVLGQRRLTATTIHRKVPKGTPPEDVFDKMNHSACHKNLVNGTGKRDGIPAADVMCNYAAQGLSND